MNFDIQVFAHQCTKKLFLVLLSVFSLMCTSLAETPASSHDSEVHTPSPTYPSDALKAGITGSGTCHVVFDASGHVHEAAMTKSTGSKVLDDSTLSFAKKNWTGQPNTALTVPIVYQLAPPAKGQKTVVIVHTPFPPYPYQARASDAQGSGIVKVTFDESGRAISAVMTTSTGSGILDGSTVNYALKEWKSSGGKRTTISVPVAYRLQ